MTSHKIDTQSVLSLRKLRTRVAHTANIVSTTGRITEKPGALWQANMETREVEWTPSFPLPPHGPLNDDDILYLIAHEASHCNWSGLYDPDKIGVPKDKAQRFHRFVNAIEDVRVDRLSAKAFGGFHDAKVQIDVRIREFHLTQSKPEGWCLVDQVALNAIFSHDLGLPPFGSDEGKAVSTTLWPTLSRIANLDSTAEVAKALVKIFLALDKADAASAPTGQQPQNQPGGSGSGQGTSMPGQPGEQKGEEKGGSASSAPTEAKDEKAGEPGADKPTDAPSKSDGKKETKPLPFGQELKGIGEDAKSQSAQDAIRDLVAEMNWNENESKDAASMQGNIPMAGSGHAHGINQAQGLIDWDKAKDRMRPQINTLANRLRATLQTNAADQYEGGHRRGQLHSSKAYRASAGNPRIFRKRTATGTVDYSFGILVDRSSSMRDRAASTLNSTVLIAEALEKAGLKSFVVSWNMRPVAMKTMGQSIASAKGKVGSAIRHPAGGTYEAPALLLAIDEFKRARTGHRMVFTITDGETRSPQESQQLIEELRDLGVKVVAIGIGYQPAPYYPDRLRINDPTELAQVLPRFINEMVRKGGH